MNPNAVPPIWTWSPNGWVVFLLLSMAILLMVAYVIKSVKK